MDAQGVRPVKAVIAASRKAADHALFNLVMTMAPLRKLGPEMTESCTRVDNALCHLMKWSRECIAHLQILDHWLRFDTEGRELVVSLLEDLQSMAEEALDLLDANGFSLCLFHPRGDKRKETAISTDAASDDEQSGNDDQEAESDADAPDDEGLNEILQDLTEWMERRGDELVSLTDTLLSPDKHGDIDRHAASWSKANKGDDSSDIARAKREFPYASGEIHERFGHANWVRRLAQDLVQQRIQKEEHPLPTQATGCTGLPRPATDAPRQDAAAWFAFHFERIAAAGRNVTSDDDDGTPKSLIPLASRSMFPPLPVPLSMIPKGKPVAFTCSLCGFDFVAGGGAITLEARGRTMLTDEDWQQHVLKDLEPYQCTHDACNHESEDMHAVRVSWYRHELVYHRLTKPWICSVCSEGFATRFTAVHHLETHASELQGAEDLGMKLRRVKLDFSQQPVGLQLCDLCGIRVEPGHCERHLAEHLEYFALLLLADGGDTSDDGSLELENDGMSDRRRTEQFVHALLTELRKMDQQQIRIQSSGAPMKGDNRLGLPAALSSGQGARRHPQAGVLLRSLSAEVMRPRRRATLVDDSLPPRSSDFIGRDEELGRLLRILSRPGCVCVLSGEHGVGKSALAIEASWRIHRNDDRVVCWWMDAASSAGQDGNPVVLAGTDRGMPMRLFRMLRNGRAQRQSARWLLVLDNVDQWKDVESLIPASLSTEEGSILITTRHSTFEVPYRPGNCFHIRLDGLSTHEGRELLLRGLPAHVVQPTERSPRNAVYKCAGDIASTLRLPCRIQYVSGCMKRSGSSPLEFWEYWIKRLGDGDDDAQKAEMDGIETDLSRDEMGVLEVMALFNGSGMQREALEWDDVQKPGPAYLRKSALQQSIGKLKEKKAVTEETQGHHRVVYTVHGRLLPKLIQGMSANGEKRNKVFRVAFDLARAHLPRPSLAAPEQEMERSSASRERLPLVLGLWRAYENPLSVAPIRPFLELAELFLDGGVLLWQQSSISEDALKLLHSAEKVVDELAAEAEVEVDRKTTIGALQCEIRITTNAIQQHYGIRYRGEINRRSAKILEYREGVSRQREGLLVVMDARADYANTLLQLNEFQAAEGIYRTCLAAYAERNTTTTTADRKAAVLAEAKLRHHLAFCLLYRRAFDEALSLARSAWETIQKIGGGDDNDDEDEDEDEDVDRNVAMTMRYRFDVGCIQLQSGALREALDTQGAVLATRQRFQGPASCFTLQSQYAVAALWHELGRLDMAESMLRTVLERTTTTTTTSSARSNTTPLVWTEAAVARTKYHLSLVLAESAAAAAGGDDGTEDAEQQRDAEQRAVEARQLAREAKEVLSRLLPYDPNPPVPDVLEKDALALFDHLQPVFDGRFTSTKLLPYYYGQ